MLGVAVKKLEVVPLESGLVRILYYSDLFIVAWLSHTYCGSSDRMIVLQFVRNCAQGVVGFNGQGASVGVQEIDGFLAGSIFGVMRESDGVYGVMNVLEILLMRRELDRGFCCRVFDTISTYPPRILTFTSFHSGGLIVVIRESPASQTKASMCQYFCLDSIWRADMSCLQHL